ncbi:MAG TPA: hypothetical protein PLK35_00870 [Candidatus Moranbacteria bacterium]|nr:hypothetical protein [Candidatus Moranbacteria bacterium]
MYTSDDLANLSPEEKSRKRHSIEMETVILDSDLRKTQREKTTLEAEIRKIKYDEERLRVIRDEKSKRLEKVSHDVTQGEEDLKRLKKQLNLIT